MNYCLSIRFLLFSLFMCPYYYRKNLYCMRESWINKKNKIIMKKCSTDHDSEYKNPS